MSHTQGKLAANGDWIGRETGGIVAIIGGFDSATNEANTRRLVACWNLLLPFTTEEIEAGIDLVRLKSEIDALNIRLKTAQNTVQFVSDMNALLKAENERLRKDAERWVFHMDNKNFRYFRNSGVWEILGQDGALIEGRATTYQDAVDAAIAATKEME